MARSAVTVIDDHLPMLNPINPRAGSRLIQAWHGLGAFKRVGYTRPTDQGGPARSSGAHQHYTAALVSGSTVRQAYAASFGLPVERVQALGAPRTDRLFNRSARAADQASVWSRWPDLRGRRIITIAPTFRGRGRRGAHYPSAWLNLEVLATALSPNDRLILHQHPFIGPWPTQRQALPEQVIDLTGKIDPNALLAVTNLLVTDYSSIIFDFALLIRAELSERSESAIRWTTDTTNGTAANGRQTAGDAGRGGQETVGPATRGSGGESGDDNLGGETGRVDLGVDRRHVDQRGDREAPSAQVIPPRSLVLYQPDADSYLANRGFYRPMAAYAFGPQVTDLPALIEAIRHPSPPDQTVLEDLWAGDLNACDGLSTGRLIALITGSQPS
jgi:CDP-glycerol glycerophosphotransferase (TagB/SpsB family)